MNHRQYPEHVITVTTYAYQTHNVDDGSLVDAVEVEHDIAHPVECDALKYGEKCALDYWINDVGLEDVPNEPGVYEVSYWSSGPDYFGEYDAGLTVDKRDVQPDVPAAHAPDAPDGPDPVAGTCRCTPTSSRCDVLLSIDGGQISLHCPTCQLAVDADIDDLLAEEIPLVMTTIVERMQADTWSGFEVGAVWHELTPPTEDAAVERFAEIVDHVRNIDRAEGLKQ